MGLGGGVLGDQINGTFFVVDLLKVTFVCGTVRENRIQSWHSPMADKNKGWWRQYTQQNQKRKGGTEGIHFIRFINQIN